MFFSPDLITPANCSSLRKPFELTRQIGGYRTSWMTNKISTPLDSSICSPITTTMQTSAMKGGIREEVLCPRTIALNQSMMQFTMPLATVVVPWLGSRYLRSTQHSGYTMRKWFAFDYCPFMLTSIETSIAYPLCGKVSTQTATWSHRAKEPPASSTMLAIF